MSWSMGCFPKQKSKHHGLTSLFGSYSPRRHSRRGVFAASEVKASGVALPPLGIRLHGCAKSAPLTRGHPAARRGGVAGERPESRDRPAAVVGLLGLAVLVTDSVQNGVILLVIAFLVSPLGLPMAAAWLVGKVQDLRYAIQDAVYG